MDRRHPGPKVITARTIAGIPKLGHEPVPALRDVPVVNADLEWTRRETIPRQGRYDHVKVLEHRQHIHVIEETAGPAVRENERHTPTRSRTLIHQVNTLPHKLIKQIEALLEGTPVKLMGEVGHATP